MSEKRANRLAAEKSPYLLQHAYNPVDWYPWGEEAWEKAKREDKPIFLSIGYSTCHWCHVMARESFEDEKVAAILNEHFVSVKVDREERPDVDATYMEVCQMMTGAGGWPLTIIMRADRKPFFAATYLPRESRFGMTGMMELLPQIINVWKHRRGEVDRVAERSVKAISDLFSMRIEGEPLDAQVLDDARIQAEKSFDESHGGFGEAPKFPLPHRIMLLLRLWRRTGDSQAIYMAERTLQAMRKGGIYDQVGFGFHRYSTDKRWLLPHFEKMLYDQALMCMAYTEAYQATGKEEYARTVREIVEYVKREMTSEEGGFFSAEDADSEGGEGRFYLWTIEEMREVLSEEEMRIMRSTFNVLEEGNFASEGGATSGGLNILHITKSPEEVTRELDIKKEELEAYEASSLRKLLEARQERRRPLRDEKILADWNGLMIAALSKAGVALEEESFVRMAEGGFQFITERMIEGGRIRHSYRDGRLSGESFHTDYAFMLWGTMELYQATLELKYLRRARELAQEMIDTFWNDGWGVFFLSPRNEGEMVFERISLYDGAVPSGNSVAFQCLIALSRLTGDTVLERRADSISKAFAHQVRQAPFAHSMFLMGLELAMNGTIEAVVVGRKTKEDTNDMLKSLRRGYRPHLLVALKEPEGDLEEALDFTRDMKMLEERATAYVCFSRECASPTCSPEEVSELIDGLWERGG